MTEEETNSRCLRCDSGLEPSGTTGRVGPRTVLAKGCCGLTTGNIVCPLSLGSRSPESQCSDETSSGLSLQFNEGKVGLNGFLLALSATKMCSKDGAAASV